MVAESFSHNMSEFDETMDPRNHSGRNTDIMMSTFSTNADDHTRHCSIEDEETETILCEEKYPTLTSEGQSLKLRTRNFPQRSAFTENGDKTKKDASNAEQISQLYTKTGQTLSSPQALAGLLNLSALFTNKASQLPHFYKSNLYRWTFIFPVGMCMVFLPLYLIHSENDSNFKNWLLIPMIGPLILYAFGVLFWMKLPTCTRTLQLRSKLESIQSFLSLCELSNEEFDQLFYEEDHGICDYKVVGSAGDGFGFFVSQGSNKQPLEEKAILTQDIDLNIFINTLSINDEKLMRVPGATGFTWIVLNAEEVMDVHDPLIKKSLFNSPGAQQYFLSAAGISHIASSYFKGTESVNAQIIEHFPALTLHTTAVGPNGNQEYEVDYAFALRCPHWPSEASEWVTRTRASIDEKTIKDIASRGCYLVHKPCGKEENQHNHEFDWRFTFASAEADLFHYHSDKRALKLAYVILKFLIKMSTKRKGILESSLTICELIKYARGSKEMPVLRTYHLKTVFLWMAEQETTLDMYRIEGNKDLGKVFMGLLDRYYKCVKEKTLPNYFMRDRNMLASSRYQDVDFENARQLLNIIRARPTYNIVSKFERQLINKKVAIGIIAILFVFSYASYSLRDISQVWSGTANARAEADIVNGLDDEDRFFTVRYLNYLNKLYSV